jgi:alpha-ribazole phosphatase
MANAAGLQLWLVRHAAPLVAPGTCYGMLDVAAQDAPTRACAQGLAQALPGPALAWHSPLQRCAQLAQAVQAARPDWPLTPDARLREMDFGTWEGRLWDSLAKADIDAWTEDFAQHRPGGGEALADMLARVEHALQDTRQRTKAAGVHHAVWLTHAGVARCVQWLQRHGSATVPRADQWPTQAPAWGAWTTLALEE